MSTAKKTTYSYEELIAIKATVPPEQRPKVWSGAFAKDAPAAIASVRHVKRNVPTFRATGEAGARGKAIGVVSRAEREQLAAVKAKFSEMSSSAKAMQIQPAAKGEASAAGTTAVAVVSKKKKAAAAAEQAPRPDSWASIVHKGKGSEVTGAAVELPPRPDAKTWQEVIRTAAEIEPFVSKEPTPESTPVKPKKQAKSEEAPTVKPVAAKKSRKVPSPSKRAPVPSFTVDMEYPEPPIPEMLADQDPCFAAAVAMMHADHMHVLQSMNPALAQQAWPFYPYFYPVPVVVGDQPSEEKKGKKRNKAKEETPAAPKPKAPAAAATAAAPAAAAAETTPAAAAVATKEPAAAKPKAPASPDAATESAVDYTTTEYDTEAGDGKADGEKRKKRRKKGPKQKEDDERRLFQRDRQLRLGMKTMGYKIWERIKDREIANESVPADPVPPAASQKCSKRSWDGQMRRWRQQLHAFDVFMSHVFSPEEIDEMKGLNRRKKAPGEESETDGAVTTDTEAGGKRGTSYAEMCSKTQSTVRKIDV